MVYIQKKKNEITNKTDNGKNELNVGILILNYIIIIKLYIYISKSIKVV